MSRGEVTAWLRAVVTPLLAKPTTLDVSLAPAGPAAVVAAVRVDPGDVGRVVGKHGATVRALQTLARAVGTPRGVDVTIVVPQAHARRGGQ